MLIDTILHQVTKPARYTGGEWNSIVKDWDKTMQMIEKYGIKGSIQQDEVVVIYDPRKDKKVVEEVEEVIEEPVEEKKPVRKSKPGPKPRSTTK